MFLDVSGVVFQYLLPQHSSVYVCIYLGGVYALMSEHILDNTQVGSAFEQGCGERVPQCVRTYCFLYSSRLGLAFYHYQYHGSCEVSSSAVEEHIILFAWFDVHPFAAFEPVIEFLYGPGGYGDKPFFFSFSEHTYELFFEI